MTARGNSELGADTLDLFVVAAEESGDQLGGALMRALRKRADGKVSFAGVGGSEMIGAD